MKESISDNSAAFVLARARTGAKALSSRLEHPTLRWCISSPIDSPRATSGLRSIPSPARRALPNAGPKVSLSHSRRLRTDTSLPPKRITFPSPSLMVQYARFPWLLFSTTRTGWLRVVIPVIGPTAPKSWFGLNWNSPVFA